MAGITIEQIQSGPDQAGERLRILSGSVAYANPYAAIAFTEAALEAAALSDLGVEIDLDAIVEVVTLLSSDKTVQGWHDDANNVMRALQLGTPASQNVAGVASTPTIITVVTEAVTITTHTGTLAHTPIAILAGDIVAAGPAAVGTANFTTIAPATTLDVQVDGTTLNTLAADSATVVNIRYAYVSQAGVASTPFTLTAGVAPGTEYGAVDLSAAAKSSPFVAIATVK